MFYKHKACFIIIKSMYISIYKELTANYNKFTIAQQCIDKQNIKLYFTI